MEGEWKLVMGAGGCGGQGRDLRACDPGPCEALWSFVPVVEGDTSNLNFIVKDNHTYVSQHSFESLPRIQVTVNRVQAVSPG